MDFLEKLKTFATGKGPTERKQIKAANKLIRSRAISAALKEKEMQEIKYARERQRLKYEKKIKSLKEPKRIFNPGAGLNYFSDSIQSKNKGRYKVI